VSSGDVPAQIGKYTVKRLLGSGGMGRVYLAVDPDIGREVAIKLVTLGSDPQASERFLREAQTMGRLNHPNIVTLLEFGVDQQSPFLVLEFLSGEDLSQWMLRLHTLREQVMVMQDIALAIAAAHKVGVLHRDLKPENVRVLDDGRCKLLDFGIAQSGAGQLTASGYFVGTPEFVAPEVMSGATHTAAADIYALGLLYYTMLCGANPFRGDTVQATVARVVQLDPMPLSRRVTGVSVELETLIHACLSKQPEARPTSAEGLALALSAELARIPADAHVGDVPILRDTAPYPITPIRSQTQASPVGKPIVTAVPVSRNLWVWAVVLLMVSAAGAWWLSQTAPLPPTPTPPAAAVQAAISRPETAAAVPVESQAPVPVQPVETMEIATELPHEPAPARTDANPGAGQPAPTTPTTATTATTAPPLDESDRLLRTAPTTSSNPVGDRAEPAAVALPVVATRPEPQLASTSMTANVSPPTVAEQQPVPLDERTATAAAEPLQLRVVHINPKVLRAGRMVTMRLEGAGLTRVSAVAIYSGGAVDARFRVGAIERAGDGALEFRLNVARGVPLGSYALVLLGENIRTEPILLEVSL